MCRIILFVFLVSLVNEGFAQQASPFSLVYEPTFSGEIKQRGSVQLAFPVMKSIHSRFVISPQYRFMQMDNSLPFGVTRFSQTTVRLMWQQKMSDRWSLNWIASPSIASAGWDYSPESFVGTTTLRFNWAKSRQMTYIAGVSYAHRFSGNLLIPVAGFRWTPSAKVTYTGTLPLWFKAEWAFTPGFQIGAFSGGTGFSAYLPGNTQYRYVWLHERNVGCSANIKVVDCFWFSLDLGYRFKQNLLAYQNIDRNSWRIGTSLTGSKQTPDYEFYTKGMFLRCTFAFRINKNSEEDSL